jgi:NAD(P)-dependent dehydrogenase (short-subunit alcohol dehydrogenase family)
MTGALRSLDGCRLIVVGASSGIGRAIAVSSSAAGARAVLSARRADRLAEVVELCGSDAVAHPCDVRDEAACDQLVATATATLGGVDAVVYTAAVSDMALVADTSAEEWHRIFETNVVGAAMVFRAASRQLRATRGRFVVISSISVQRPKPGLVPYAASKAALESLIVGMRTEEPDVDFTIVTVGPTAGGDFGRDFDPAVAEQLMALWRAGGFLNQGQMKPDDVAHRVVECLAAPMQTEAVILLPRPESAP